MLNEFLQTNKFKEVDLKVKHENYEYTNSPCMIFIWNPLLQDTHKNIKHINSFVSSYPNNRVILLYTIGIHHFNSHQTASEALLTHYQLENSLPMVIDLLLKADFWSKNRNLNSFIWRTAPAAEEGFTSPLRMARWAYKSTKIIKEMAENRSLNYFYNSGYHFDPEKITGHSSKIDNSNNTNLTVSSMYILDHFSHVENVSYGTCRNKGDSLAHFGLKGRSAMLDSLLWMLDDICNLKV
jgi:hypothetical protein